MADGGTAKLTGEVAELTSLVQNAYRDARGFEADFEQTYRNRLLDRQQKSQGHVWLRPPTRMRWEYATPTKNLIVADGRTLFVFEPEPNQVVRMPVASSELPAVMAFLTGGRDLNLDYHVALVAPDVSVALRARGQGGLELVPRSPSSVVERVVLVVARDTGQVQKTVLVEPEGNTNTFVWSKVRTADSLPDSRFSFTPPPDARVIERGR
jgi:outer membrane lipoprotein carrier protein